MSARPRIDESAVATERVACALCGASDTVPFAKTANVRQGCAREYALCRCSRCGLVYTNPRPTQDAILRYYVETDPEKSRRKPSLHETAYFRAFRRIPAAKKGSLLDVGCGSGRYLYLMEREGWTVKGVDIAYTDYGRTGLGLDIYEGSLMSARFAPESFDAVTFWWTLEHMFDPLAMLREAYRIAKKGGIVVVGVPNIDSLEAKIFKEHWFHLFVPKHLYQFSPATLTAALRKAGFGRVQIRHDLFSFGLIGSLQCLLNARGVPVTLTNPLCYALSLPVDILLGLCRQGGLITAYATKE